MFLLFFLIKKILDIFLFLFPSTCLLCHKLIEDDVSFCFDCWKKIDFISNFYCKICGKKILISDNESYICASCIFAKPKFTIARFLFIFDKNTQKMIYEFKYHDKTHLSKHFAKLLLARYRSNFDDIDIIIPVPMHNIKKLYRKYNPAEILAKDIAKKMSKKFLADVLVKTKFTKSQTYFTKKQRLLNIRNSIKANSKYNLDNKKILLVDDVYTTGVTADICAQILLKKFKFSEVRFCAIARTEKILF
ncbi:MAG: ComF family protein [Rickettsia sp.]|nr:ComF family protein [Rickettsia sp.]